MIGAVQRALWLEGARSSSDREPGLGPPHGAGRLERRGPGGGVRPKSSATAATGRSRGWCVTVRRRSKDRPVRCADAAVMQYGIAADRVTSEGRMDSAMSGRYRNEGPAGRVWTPRPPPARRGWNGTASGMLAGALEALGVDQRALGQNPSGDNGLDELLAARASRSVRTSRTWRRSPSCELHGSGVVALLGPLRLDPPLRGSASFQPRG